MRAFFNLSFLSSKNLNFYMEVSNLCIPHACFIGHRDYHAPRITVSFFNGITMLDPSIRLSFLIHLKTLNIWSLDEINQITSIDFINVLTPMSDIQEAFRECDVPKSIHSIECYRKRWCG